MPSNTTNRAQTITKNWAVPLSTLVGAVLVTVSVLVAFSAEKERITALDTKFEQHVKESDRRIAELDGARAEIDKIRERTITEVMALRERVIKLEADLSELRGRFERLTKRIGK